MMSRLRRGVMNGLYLLYQTTQIYSQCTDTFVHNLSLKYLEYIARKHGAKLAQIMAL